MTLSAWITVLALVLVGSTGSGGGVYWLLNRNSQRVQDGKIKAERESFEAAAAEKWQRILDENATKAYEKVESRCKKCETSLDIVVGVLGSVLTKAAPVLDCLARGVPVEPSLVGDLTAQLHLADREFARHT